MPEVIRPGQLASRYQVLRRPAGGPLYMAASSYLAAAACARQRAGTGGHITGAQVHVGPSIPKDLRSALATTAA
jgi:hypothetical protein